MKNALYIQKELKNSHLVWFSNSGKFVLLKKPLLKIVKMMEQKAGFSEIYKLCNAEMMLNKVETDLFLQSVKNKIQDLNQPKPLSIQCKRHQQIIEFQNNAIKKTYSINQNTIEIKYGNKEIADSFHPLFAHLEIKTSANEPNHKIQLLSLNKKLYFYHNEYLQRISSNQDFAFFKGAVLKKIYSIIYKIQEKDWMMTIHASSVIRDNQAILFVGKSGSGKSTMAAQLNSQDFACISDDFTAVDKSGNVYPFPAAVSIKPGSFNIISKLYPQLNQNKNNFNSVSNTPRHYPLFNKNNSGPYPIKAIVFLEFKKIESTLFRKIYQEKAIQFLLRESWVNPQSETVTNFFKLISKIPFYRCSYPSKNNVSQHISNLFLP